LAKQKLKPSLQKSTKLQEIFNVPQNSQFSTVIHHYFFASDLPDCPTVAGEFARSADHYICRSAVVMQFAERLVIVTSSPPAVST
jgi:hypothetical protein